MKERFWRTLTCTSFRGNRWRSMSMKSQSLVVVTGTKCSSRTSGRAMAFQQWSDPPLEVVSEHSSWNRPDSEIGVPCLPQLGWVPPGKGYSSTLLGGGRKQLYTYCFKGRLWVPVWLVVWFFVRLGSQVGLLQDIWRPCHRQHTQRSHSLWLQRGRKEYNFQRTLRTTPMPLPKFHVEF